MQVNQRVLVQRKAVLVGFEDPDTGTVEAPQCGTQIAGGADVVSNRPQTASDVAALNPSSVQGHEDKKALAAFWDVHSAPTVRDKRATEQVYDGRIPRFAAKERMHEVCKQ